MSVDIEVDGGAQLYDLGRRLRAAPKKLQTAARRRLTRAVKPLQSDIRAEIEPVMPKGYEQVLSKSLQFRTQIKTTYWAAITLTTSAKGQKKAREIRAMDKGILRHPVHGRYRRTKRGRVKNPWVAQEIKPRFWSRPVESGAPKIRRELVKVMSDIKDEITKG